MFNFSGKRISVFLHIAAWSVLFLLPIYLTSTERKVDMFFVGRVYMRTISYVALFYINFFWLVPLVLFKGKKLKFYLSLVGIILALYIISETVNLYFFTNLADFANLNDNNSHKPSPFFFWRFDIYNYLLTSILISGFSLALRMSAKYNENEKKRKELEKEKLSSELAFLKNQVSPHFFFNTLNNIYSLTEINTKEAQNAILQLSKLMRYLLYESEKGDIRLGSEIAFMKNYIDLMKLRINDKVSLSTSFPDNDPPVFIPPLIFIPFIENAFKHGVSYREQSFIHIEVTIHNNEIFFRCRNSLSKKHEDISDSGIGLDNVTKRLALLFPGMHQLSITQENNVFDVSLSIQVNSEQL